MNKYIKWAVGLIAAPVLLLVILFLLFYYPPFQKWAVKQVTAYASDQTGLQISIDHVNLEFPLDLGIEGLKVIQPNDSLPQVKDTVADIRQLIVDVDFWPLLKSKVVINELDFRQMKVNTTNFIPEARIKGQVGRLFLQQQGQIDWARSVVKAATLSLADARLDVALSDTVPPDTTPSENFWKVYAEHLTFKNTDFTLHLPGDTMSFNAYLGQAKADGVFLDLNKGHYQVRHIDWQEGKMGYDMNYETKGKGLDYNHLFLSDLSLKADSFYYADSRLGISLREGRFREKSGLVVDELSGPFGLDSTRLWMPDLHFHTPGSALAGSFDMTLDAFADENPGRMNAVFRGHLGKKDLLLLLGEVSPEVRRRWPDRPLQVDGAMWGNLRRLNISRLMANLSKAFHVKASGHVLNPLDEKHIKADLAIKAQAQDVDFLTAMFDVKPLRVPSGLDFDGSVKIDGTQYQSAFVARQGGGRVKGSVSFDADKVAYTAHLAADNLPVQRFLPDMGLHPFTGTVDIKGEGSDFLSPRTRLEAKADIVKFRYGDYQLDRMKGTATIQHGVAHAHIHSQNALMAGQLNVDALLNRKITHATVSGDLSHVDLYRLRIADMPLSASFCAHVDLATDFSNYYKVQGMVSDITVHDKDEIYRPEAVVLDVMTSRDTTHAVVDCGDFHLNMDASGGYEHLLKAGNAFVAELQQQLKNRTIDQLQLRHRLPVARIYLTSGKQNLFSRLLRKSGYELHSVFMDMASSPIRGLNGKMQIDSLVMDSILLDTVRFAVASNDSAMTYQAQVRNNKKNPQYTFNALLDGAIIPNGTQLSAHIYDEDNKLGIGLGLAGEMAQNGLLFHLTGQDPVLGYKTFKANADNYLLLGDDRRVSADLKLRANDGMGVQVFTNDSNVEALQDITVSLYQFDLKRVLSVIPYTPDVSGMMNGDFHLIQTKDEMSVSSNLAVDNMVYEHSPMGNVSTEFVYMPKAGGAHSVDGILMSDGQEVAAVNGTYWSEGPGRLDATLSLERLPMSMANGFIPDRLIGFKGFAEGDLSIKGQLAKPQVNGEVFLDSAYMVSEPYGVELRFDNDPVTITDSHLLFENFNMYAHNDQPLMLSGYYDFSDLEHMRMDVKMRAENFQLIDAKENLRSEAFGKAFVNFYGRMTGEVDDLRLGGKLDVLGATDMTYILRDSPLTTDNTLNELVQFTDFSDSTVNQVTRPPLTGFSMDLHIGIDESAHILCALNADKSNYVDLIGGGDLRMQYDVVDNLRLTGRYTLSNGEMKYSLPVIPLKTFTIQDGSYLEFSGDPFNPRLNITATEKSKASVASGTGSGRIVEFDCGVKITKTLNDMGLEFIINAPADMEVSNQLNTMSTEERGKIAVSMLTTGMYLADGNTSAFTMNTALSAFLQSQINGIAGNAFRTLDLDFGVDNATDANGNIHTDYSFKFSKRFWNNRLRVIIGGKLSSGPDVANQNQSFFDNVQFEYRLNQKSTQYLKLFYQRDSYDWLEGNTSRYGGGFIWRRKLDHFRDIFRFKEPKPAMAPSVTDTLKQTHDEAK